MNKIVHDFVKLIEKSKEINTKEEMIETVFVNYLPMI